MVGQCAGKNVDLPARDVLEERAGANRCAGNPGFLEVFLERRFVYYMVISMLEPLKSYSRTVEVQRMSVLAVRALVQAREGAARWVERGQYRGPRKARTSEPQISRWLPCTPQ